MSWRSRNGGASAWRQCLAPLRQEAAAKGFVAHPNLQAALESLRAAAAEVQNTELAEDLPFLIQQLLGPQPTHGVSSIGSSARDTSPHVALCRLLTSLTSSRTLSLHGPAANLILSALRQWSDGAQEGAATPTSNGRTQSGANPSTPNTSAASAGAPTSAAPIPSSSSAADGAAPAAASPAASLPLEAMTALAAVLPDHLGLLSEHERAVQLAALLSLLMPQPSQPRAPEGARGRAVDVLELQVLALNTLAACCGRAGTGTGAASGAGAGGLTVHEAGALLSAAVSLLQACASRSRPVEDAAHSRLYAALVRALQAAIGEVKQAWVARAAMLVEGLQRFLTYGVQASLTAAAAAAAPAAPDGAGAGGRYRPPHLRRRESQTDGGGGGGGSAWSDSDVSDSEHTGGGGGGSSAGAGSGAAVVDRFRSSRVRLAALSCIQAMAKSDPRAMHVHWSALLPLQAPLQQRPLTPHLITVLLYDPLIKVRLLAAATISSLLDGPAQRSILAVAEAKSMSGRAGPVRGFLTLSLSLGQLLLAAHAGLLQAVAAEASGLVLPGVLRALVVLMAASPYERLPPELLPEALKVLRMRWAALTGAVTASAPASHATTATTATTAAAAGELAPIQAAYLACLAECFSTKHPIPGLAAFLLHQQQQQQQSQSPNDAEPRGAGAGSGCGGCCSTEQLVRELLAVGRDGAAAAVLRIEALAALKGLAAHYTAALPPDVWEDLRATSAMGLSCIPSPRSPTGSRYKDGLGLPSRSSSSSSLGGFATATHGSSSSSGRPGDRVGPRPVPAPWGSPGGASAAQAAAGPAGASSANSSPEDKAAQLSVKLLSDYLSASARQYGISRTEAGGAGSGDGGEGGLPGPPPSPGFVPLAAAVPRQQAGLLSPVSVCSEEEREAGVHRLAAMWQDAVAVLVPAATSHTSYMVRSAGLACLGEVPEPVFSRLPQRLQQQLLTLLSDAAAGDAVPAVRAAACKALGAAAAFPAVLAQPQLSDHATRALLPCLRDAVLSARIAAGWAVANLCDAYRRLLLENPAPDPADAEQQLRAQRAESHAQASTSARGGGFPAAPAAVPPQSLELHHYRQLAALCGAAITATHDADKVRANGIRAVGYLLAALTPDMAPGLAAAAGGGGGVAVAAELAASGSSGASWRAARREAPSAVTSGGHGKHTSVCSGGTASPNTKAGSAGGWGEGLQLDGWLDGALTCLQSTLTTGGMKVQWNACCAAHGLLRNQRLLGHPRVATRVAQLLLLLVMLVRESANFKIRTHAAAALAALPSREAYGDVLPDALLVTAGALEAVSNGGGAVVGAKPAGAGASGGAEQRQEGDGDGEGDGGEGRFPNYRYTVGLSAQLRATLLHLLALVRPADARRVRDALARRAEFLHACLREQLAEAAQPLRAAAAAAARGGGAAAAKDCVGGMEGWGASGCAAAVDLPADPFGLSARRGSSPGGAATTGGLAGLFAGLSLAATREGRASSPPPPPDCGPGTCSIARDVPAGVGSGTGWEGAGNGGRSRLTVRVSGLVEEDEELRRARDRVMALAAPLRGFADLLAQLGPACEPILQDVRQALAQLPPAPAPAGSASGPAR
ncbi:hypothetical protein PLESTB_000492500 [Pleodorina starrii]|uniref:DUF4042 domain-containing protein n=1 Tax=Pleodorina starrii TaxID=330485 RepID=A0A9W6F0Q0_9CHLO|nr:hypothetical protein PLESTM_000364000 [Pleodorina starrii]GLC51346.1 hypothetical protein PLESTB_000492500 [Pleodorina starrii]GLC63711.1 hypothetical protein PLESTF_000066000 [Pleodorina starrii]